MRFKHFKKFVKPKSNKAFLGGLGGAITGGLGILGGISGAFSKKQRQSSSSGINLNISSALQDRLQGTAALSTADQAAIREAERRLAVYRRRGDQKGINVMMDEIKSIRENPTGKRSGGLMDQLLTDFQGLVGAGPGQQDIAASLGAQRDLAAMFESAMQTGFMPTAADITQTGGLAAQLMAPEQVMLNQLFQDQQTQAAQQAAMMGRGPLDPVLRNKLAQSQAREQALLGARQGALGTELAMMLPQQRLQAAQGRAETMGNLANQAFANRMNLMQLGSGLLGSERQFQIATSDQWGKQSGSSGGGLGGAIGGAMAGIGGGLQLASMFGSAGTAANISSGPAVPGNFSLGSYGRGNQFTAYQPNPASFRPF